MRFLIILPLTVCAVLAGVPALAQQAGGRIGAEQHDIGRVQARIQKYDQALGVVSQLTRPLGAETECHGVCYFPNGAGAISWRCAPSQKCDLRCTVNPPVGGCD